MRTSRPSITYEALLAALTLGVITALPACKGGAIKSEAPPASQAPEAPPSAGATPVIQGTAPQPPPPPGVASPDSDARRKGTTESSVSSTVDAGRELNAPSKGSTAPKPTKNEPNKPGGSAACGGSSCSPDMKKGN